MSIEEMKAELIEAGYEFLPEYWEGMSFDEFTGWVKASNGDWIEGESFGYRKSHEADIARNQADNSCIQKAYKHLQQQLQFTQQAQEIAALQARVSELEADCKHIFVILDESWDIVSSEDYQAILEYRKKYGIVKREGE